MQEKGKAEKEDGMYEDSDLSPASLFDDDLPGCVLGKAYTEQSSMCDNEA